MTHIDGKNQSIEADLEMTDLLDKIIQHISYVWESKEKKINKLRRAIEGRKETQIEYLK